MARGARRRGSKSPTTLAVARLPSCSWDTTWVGKRGRQPKRSAAADSFVGKGTDTVKKRVGTARVVGVARHRRLGLTSGAPPGVLLEKNQLLPRSRPGHHARRLEKITVVKNGSSNGTHNGSKTSRERLAFASFQAKWLLAWTSGMMAVFSSLPARCQIGAVKTVAGESWAKVVK